MTKILNPIQIEKYDINQKIIRELTNLASRHILFSIIKKSKTGEEVARDTNIPLVTVYKKLHVLEDLALIFVERMDFSYSGKRMKFYKSKIKEAQISINIITPQLKLMSNKKITPRKI